MSTTEPAHVTNFLRTIVEDDLKSGKHRTIVTRFPPEPNGYLHIGHAKSICLNFGLARDFGGRCHLRFDDTNPVKEETEYIESIKESVRWLGFEWGEHCYYASDYFEQLYQWAESLIIQGKAYVDDLTADEIRSYRGTLTEPGKESPSRSRTAEENLDLFRRMRAGEFPDGAKVLRARIDMASPNINLRDPVMYRILHAPHPHAGDKWCIYPMYDYAHGQSDAIEGITHSICTLEFEDHKPLYEWFLDNLPVPNRPRQYEFARLNLTYAVMSKRKLLQLVKDGDVTGWDDPRMPTIMGIRRRGFTPEAIRNFCDTIGVGRSDSWIDMSILEESVRQDLNERAPRVMAVLRPLRLVIENYPEGATEDLTIAYHPQRPDLGSRSVPFGRELFIERDDFMEVPPKGFKRLSPGEEIRLRGAYIVKCTGVERDGEGNVTTVRCTYDPETRSGLPGSERKVKGVIHWVSATHAVTAEVRLYDRLFTVPNPSGDDWKELLNPLSVEIVRDCRLEPSLALARPEDRFQFERQGYFCADRVDSQPGAPVFNRTVTLRDSWAKK
ncbi:glutamine--tRNA ligase/YqeY domain fusion protein [Geobacter sulfurreducens]|uniref:Glutamine--tRNA ligase n=1 Tax=Geobacter sulfurreducens (strain ATCC 51573 / DSM 12127 / PCA) TaxID=243231 RepID=Q747A1_GEOSL|nr:glutamine--tRNA ligase/YqeY domain fusion protein [Geobacter sulfurreducens]AAR36756.1 glutaminyl-tRNA synthetase [Geobacter sulfurreducens PCA]AJY69591.1 glutamate--tRNA ligase [Geobacter sulfurreducens]UAC04015.1 glutamine--tRNA ligase/YqeY domain fusion protein [Geobacter sulfurreducens]HBB70040.1 glutamine--tRNA ligase/YqeY domain fusion protein [Geobacter sulfurreducens]HCD96613.1 glutamine--tRNA ligase/YqeY domain fusion protein [Geobacter sulfurreducens]